MDILLYNVYQEYVLWWRAVAEVRFQIERATLSYIIPEPDYVSFVSKMQKVKTRRDKDYFIFRVTVPKDAAEKSGVQPGEFLLFKAKKAEWYDMLDWSQMQEAWQRLPQETRNRIVLSGLPYPGMVPMASTQGIAPSELGTTNPAALPISHSPCVQTVQSQ
jgi:hypothetical protein